MDIKRVGKILKAFSVIELIVSVVVISCVIAAFAPVMSKRISTQDIIAGDAQCILSECEDVEIDINKSVLPSTEAYKNSTEAEKKELIKLKGCTLCDKCKKECIECPLSCVLGEYKHEIECRCGECEEELGSNGYNITDHCIKCSWNHQLKEPQCDWCKEGYYLEQDKDKRYRCKPCHIGHRCKGGPRTDTENGEVECLPDSSNQQYQDKTKQSSCSNCHDKHNCLTCKTIANLGEACANKTNCASSEYCATCPSDSYFKEVSKDSNGNPNYICIKCGVGSTPNSNQTGCVCRGCNTWSADSNTCYYDCDKGGCGDCDHCGYNCPPPPCEGTYTNGEFCHKSGPREGECCTHTYEYQLVQKRQVCSSCPHGFSIYYECEGVWIGCLY